MNMIVCDQQCRHQQEGYCTLNQITRLTGSAADKCGYFEPRPDEAAEFLSAQDLQRL